MGKEQPAIEIAAKAKEFGAHLVGFADTADILNSPSAVLYGKLRAWAGIGSSQKENKPQDADTLKPGAKYKLELPQDSKTIVVIAIRHPKNQPALDWYQEQKPGGTKGNLVMIRVINKLSKWLEEEKKIKSKKIPYVIESGGVFLKDAAALAGIGVVGKNNMLVTPDYGPRVRFRALSLPVELGSTGLLDFDPCTGCSMPCRTVCPEQSFEEKIYTPENYGLEILPGKEGSYSREKCNIEMLKNVDNGQRISVEVDNVQKEILQVDYCRRCEFACPIGRGK